jgi:hypothetical protein
MAQGMWNVHDRDATGITVEPSKTQHTNVRSYNIRLGRLVVCIRGVAFDRLLTAMLDEQRKEQEEHHG